MVTASAVQAKFASNAHNNYVKALQLGDILLAQVGIVTPMRLAHFMAQVLHETGGLRILRESGSYSRNALARMWDGGNWHLYFANREACLAMAEQCAIDKGEALFNLVYGGRMGNGPPSSGDGWTFRGRGLIQTTGRESYEKFGKLCGVPFGDDPDLVVDPAHALKPALAEWTSRNLNAAADANDIKVITLRINGGTVGLDERKACFAKIWPFISGGQPIELSIEWRVQEALTKAGFNTKGVDGVIGKNSRSAILDFRMANNLPGPPQITQDLLLALGLVKA
jgi:putative chitinase